MKAISLVLALGLSVPLYAVEFEGIPLVSAPPVSIAVDASTGLDGGVYVLPSTQGVRIMYTMQSADASLKWYRFSNLGGAYGEELAVVRSGATASIEAQASDMGYIIEEGALRTCFWVVDYSAHRLSMNALTPSNEQECGRLAMSFSGDAAEITYYTINGRRMVLSRELVAEYNTLKFDENSFSYVTATTSETIDAIGTTLSLPAPLCNTTVSLRGDKFLRAWGDEMSIESPTVTAVNVECETRATQNVREVDNEQKSGSDGLGGSAPCDIFFEASVSDAAVFTEWQISRSPDFDINENTFSDLSFEYTFREQGTTYIRFIANNADGTCEYIGATYEVFIGESRLDIPNAFSPNASPGVNDEWKVSYKSLVSYECHIFNRYGTRMFSSTDPAQGWDGKYGGKYVPAGVYFYVIKAEGADGIKYKRSGDINIMNYKQGSFSGSNESIGDYEN